MIGRFGHAERLLCVRRNGHDRQQTRGTQARAILIRRNPACLELLLQLRDTLLEFRNAFPERRQLTKDRGRLQPVAVGNGGIAGDALPGIDRVRNAGLRRRDHALADPQMSGDADLAGQHDVVLDRRCCRRCRPARRSSTRSPTVTPCAICTRLSILVPRADARLADRRTIDGGIGADLDVVFDDHVGVLRDLEVRAVGLARRTRTRRCR